MHTLDVMGLTKRPARGVRKIINVNRTSQFLCASDLIKFSYYYNFVTSDKSPSSSSTVYLKSTKEEHSHNFTFPPPLQSVGKKTHVSLCFQINLFMKQRFQLELSALKVVCIHKNERDCMQIR